MNNNLQCAVEMNFYKQECRSRPKFHLLYKATKSAAKWRSFRKFIMSSVFSSSNFHISLKHLNLQAPTYAKTLLQI